MAKIVWTEPAVEDLNRIAEYIALENHEAASRLLARIFERVEVVGDHPKSVRVPPELSGGYVREVVVPPCRIFYRLDENIPVILHIRRQEVEDVTLESVWLPPGSS